MTRGEGSRCSMGSMSSKVGGEGSKCSMSSMSSKSWDFGRG